MLSGTVMVESTPEVDATNRIATFGAKGPPKPAAFMKPGVAVPSEEYMMLADADSAMNNDRIAVRTNMIYGSANAA